MKNGKLNLMASSMIALGLFAGQAWGQVLEGTCDGTDGANDNCAVTGHDSTFVQSSFTGQVSNTVYLGWEQDSTAFGVAAASSKGTTNADETQTSTFGGSSEGGSISKCTTYTSGVGATLSAPTPLVDTGCGS